MKESAQAICATKQVSKRYVWNVYQQLYGLKKVSGVITLECGMSWTKLS